MRKKRRRTRRPRRRARARNSWRVDRAGHKRAAKKGWARRRRRKGGRRKARNRGYSYNRKRRGSRRRRRLARNTGAGGLSLGRPFKALTAGFTPNTILKAGMIAGGAIGNQALATTIDDFLPAMFQRGQIGSYATGLASAGLLGALIGMVSRPLAAPVFLGGVIGEVTRALNEFVLPMIPGLTGLGDYLTVTDAQVARPLGDYLTVTDAQVARPLGDYEGGSYISEELAGY